METFSVLLAICAGNSPVPDEFPAQRPVTRSFDIFFDLRLNKRLSKQSWGWWFETLSRPLWLHFNGFHPQRASTVENISYVCIFYGIYFICQNTSNWCSWKLGNRENIIFHIFVRKPIHHRLSYGYGEISRPSTISTKRYSHGLGIWEGFVFQEMVLPCDSFASMVTGRVQQGCLRHQARDGGSHTRWRHKMETFSALLAICVGNSPVPGEFPAFSALLAICVGNSPVPGEFPAHKPVTRSFDVFFDLRLNKRLSKQLWGWWFETLSRPLWCHRNDSSYYLCSKTWWHHHMEMSSALLALCGGNLSPVALTVNRSFFVFLFLFYFIFIYLFIYLSIFLAGGGSLVQFKLKK